MGTHKQDVVILTLSDRARWEAEHEQYGLPSQSLNYAWGLAASGIEPRLAVVRDGASTMLLPFFERVWQGTTDIATVPGLSGASIVPASEKPLLLWREFAVSQGWVAGYIQLAYNTIIEQVVTDSSAHNAVFLINPRSWDSHSTPSENIQKKVQAAVQAGATIVDDNVGLWAALEALYPVAMARLKISSSIFSSETIRRWSTAPTTILLGAARDTKIEIVNLFLTSGIHAEFHISAASLAGRDLSAFLLSEAIARMAIQGYGSLNMGGGVRIGDGIYAFKRRFGGQILPLRSVRQIYDFDKYSELCAATGVAAGEKWFPAYRRFQSTPVT